MAPKRSSMGGERAAKRQATSKCALVLTELRNTDKVPPACRTMLVNMAEPTLTTYAADRHPFQVQAIGMVEKTFASIEAELEKTIAENQTTVDSADAEKASRAAALATAEAKMTELQQGATGAKEALDADALAEKQAKAEMAEALATLKAKEDELASNEKKKNVLEEATNLYGLLKTSGHEPQGRKTTKRFTSVLADFELEEFVVKSVGEALGKEAADRGTFDGVVLKHADEQLAEWAATVESILKSGNVSKEELTKAKTTAEESHAAAAGKIEGKKAAYQAATTAVSEGKQALKEAETAVKSFEKEISTAAKSLESAKAALLSFKEGPLKAFAELKNLAPPPEPVPEPVVESAEGNSEAVGRAID